jgi:hypothetical protein
MLSSGSTQAKAAQKEGTEQLNRACEPCRLLKVRCLPDPQSQSGICQVQHISSQGVWYMLMNNSDVINQGALASLLRHKREDSAFERTLEWQS